MIGEHIQRSHLRVEVRKWMISKLAPKRCGDRVAVGGDADAPLVRVSLSGGELARKLAFLLTKGRNEIERSNSPRDDAVTRSRCYSPRFRAPKSLPRSRSTMRRPPR